MLRRTLVTMAAMLVVGSASAFLDKRMVRLGRAVDTASTVPASRVGSLPDGVVARTADRGQPAEPSGPPMVMFQGREIPNTIDEILNPKHTVLVVHELLNDFISIGGAQDKAGRRYNADSIIQPVAELLAAARAKHVRVAHVRWTRFADGSTNSDPQRRTAAGRSGAPSNIEGTWGWEIADAVKPAPGDWVLRKYRPDAFFATPLDTLMHWNGIKTLVIVGPGAEVGILPTLMHASNLGYFRIAVKDLITAADPKRIDDAMRFIEDQAIIKTQKEVMDVWQAAKPTPSS